MIRKIVFMGTPDFAASVLQALLDCPDYEVLAVFSQPDQPRGRGKTLQAPPVKETALAAGIPVYQPERIRDGEAEELLRALCPDAIVVVAFGQILPKSILELPAHGCINVHASLLPKYRGAAPIQWAILDGEKETGVTTMRMDGGLDTGDMIKKTVVPIGPQETGGSLFDKLAREGALLLLDTLEAINAGEAVYEPQPAESPTRYASMLTKKQGEIDWSDGVEKIECQVRGLNPWPSAYTRYRGRTLKVWAAKAEPSSPAEMLVSAAEVPAGPPAGTVVEVTRRTLKVQAGDGLLSILELQPEGKKRMAVDAFLRGYPVVTGEKLG